MEQTSPKHKGAWLFLLVALMVTALAQTGEAALSCHSTVYGESGYRVRVETQYNAGCQFCGPVDFWYDWGDGTSNGFVRDQPSGLAVIRHTYPSVPGAQYTLNISVVSEATSESCSYKEPIRD
jgi:hypothetical protein